MAQMYIHWEDKAGASNADTATAQGLVFCDSGLIHTGRGTRRACKLECKSFDIACCSVNTPIDDNRSHLLALRCASHCTSCVNGASVTIGEKKGNPISIPPGVITRRFGTLPVALEDRGTFSAEKGCLVRMTPGCSVTNSKLTFCTK